MAQSVTSLIMRNASLLHPVWQSQYRSKSQLRELEKQRKEWILGIRSDAGFHRLFDYIPGVFFFAKDRQGRTMFTSQGILDLYGMKDASEMIGLTDYDLNPAVMAAHYVADDERILTGAAEHIERLELWFDRQGMPDWFVVNKLPILDSEGLVHGVMGLLRRASEHEMQLPVFQTVAKAVELIRRDYQLSLRMSDVANRCGQSLRQLQRHFQSAFGTTPQEFLLRTRILGATKLLEETRLSMAEIAAKCGFTDVSAFTQQFRLRCGQTPASYRQSYLA